MRQCRATRDFSLTVADPDTPILRDKEQLCAHAMAYAFHTVAPEQSVPLSLVSSNLAGCSTSIFLNGPPLTALLSLSPSLFFTLQAAPPPSSTSPPYPPTSSSCSASLSAAALTSFGLLSVPTRTIAPAPRGDASGGASGKYLQLTSLHNKRIRAALCSRASGSAAEAGVARRRDAADAITARYLPTRPSRGTQIISRGSGDNWCLAANRGATSDALRAIASHRADLRKSRIPAGAPISEADAK